MPPIETASPYGLWLAVLALGITAVLVARFIVRLAKNRATCFDFVLLGYGVLAILDIVSYELFYHHLRDDIEAEYRIKALAWLLVSVATFSIVYSLAPRTRPLLSSNTWNLTTFSENRFLTIVAPTGIVLGLSHVVGRDLVNIPYVDLAGYAAKAAVILSFFLYLETRKRIYAIYAVGLLLLSTTDTSRRAFLVVLLPLLLMYVDRAHAWKRQGTTGMTLRVALLVGGLFLFSMFMRSTHDFGEGYVEGDRIGNTLNYIANLRIADTYYNTAFLIKNFPDTYPYYFGETYVAIPVGIVPRSWWPDKPVGLGALLGLMQTVGSSEYDHELWLVNQFSLAPGFVGEAYANFGPAGVIVLSMLLGLGTRMVDKRFVWNFALRRIGLNTVPILPFLPGLMLAIRGDFYAAMLYPIFVSGFLYVFVRLVQRRWQVGARNHDLGSAGPRVDGSARLDT